MANYHTQYYCQISRIKFIQNGGYNVNSGAAKVCGQTKSLLREATEGHILRNQSHNTIPITANSKSTCMCYPHLKKKVYGSINVYLWHLSVSDVTP